MLLKALSGSVNEYGRRISRLQNPLFEGIFLFSTRT